MSFVPNVNGGVVPLGLISVPVAGTGVPLDTNLEPKMRPSKRVSRAYPQQYALALEDIIISSPPGNSGGLYLVSNNAQTDVSSKSDTDSLILYIPRGSGPVSLAQYFGGNRFQPGDYAIDVDQGGDTAIVVGKGNA